MMVLVLTMGNLMVVSVEECSSRALVSRYGQAVVALKIFAKSVEKYFRVLEKYLNHLTHPSCPSGCSAMQDSSEIPCQDLKKPRSVNWGSQPGVWVCRG